MNIKQLATSFIGFVIRAVVLVFAILAIYRAGQAAYDFGFRIFTEEPMTPEPGRDVSITIVQGDSVLEVGEMLEEKGLIRDAKLFFIQKKCSVYDGDIKPGFYTLNTSMTSDDMFAIIAGSTDGDSEESDDEIDIQSEAEPLVEEGEHMEADPLQELPGDIDVSPEDMINTEAEEDIPVEE